MRRAVWYARHSRYALAHVRVVNALLCEISIHSVQLAETHLVPVAQFAQCCFDHGSCDHGGSSFVATKQKFRGLF